ncbi:MAG: 50S ribosomal protein L9 [Anaerolineae bacterium]|nr:50S ribosomal protein L9 [Anaerolineae bacterium]
MQVLLKKDVAGLGHAGDVKRVADGYALNFLIPRGLAMVATESAVKQAKQIKDAADRQRQRQHSEAEVVVQKLAGVSLTFTAKAGEGDKLYGSVTGADIAEAIEKATGEVVDKRRVELAHPIKELGAHQVLFRLAPEVVAQVTVVVQREGETSA